MEGNCGQLLQACVERESTVTEKLRARRDRLVGELERVNAALTELEREPRVAQVLDALSKLDIR